MSGFNETAYLDANPDVAKAVKAGLVASGWQQWITNGQAEGRPLAPTDAAYATFNELAYLAKNVDVATAVDKGTYATGWQHFITNGQAEGRLGNPSIGGITWTAATENGYLDNNPDVAKVVHAGLNPIYSSGLAHWLVSGSSEASIGRVSSAPSNPLYASSNFNETAYLEANPDVALAVTKGTFATGWQHYVAFGQAEHRILAPTDFSIGNKVIAVSAANTAVDLGNGGVYTETFNVATGNYTHTINHFAAGDILNFVAGATIAVTPDANVTDGIKDIVATNPDATTTTIHLIGLSAAQDAALFNVPSVNTLFGAGTIHIG